MRYNLPVYKFTCAFTDVLPSTQKEFKIVTPEEGGYNPKMLDEMLTAGEPFLITGKVGGQYTDETIFITDVKRDNTNNLIYIAMRGLYMSNTFNTLYNCDIILQYDPVLKILKGRRP